MTMEEGLALVNKVVYDLECEQDIICQPLMKLLMEKSTAAYTQREIDNHRDQSINMMTAYYDRQMQKAH
jgi:hypothetical protein